LIVLSKNCLTQTIEFEATEHSRVSSLLSGLGCLGSSSCALNVFNSTSRCPTTAISGRGVRCNANGRVIDLVLDSNELTGTINDVIAMFTSLTRLNLASVDCFLGCGAGAGVVVF
jgi:hypothetical protein